MVSTLLVGPDFPQVVHANAPWQNGKCGNWVRFTSASPSAPKEFATAQPILDCPAQSQTSPRATSLMTILCLFPEIVI